MLEDNRTRFRSFTFSPLPSSPHALIAYSTQSSLFLLHGMSSGGTRGDLRSRLRPLRFRPDTTSPRCPVLATLISVLKQGGTQQHEQIDRHLSNGNGNPPGADCNLCVRFAKIYTTEVRFSEVHPAEICPGHLRTSLRSAPLKSAPFRSAPARFTRLRCAPLKSTPEKSGWIA